ALFAMSRELVDTATMVQLAQSAVRHVGDVFAGQVYVLLPDSAAKPSQTLVQIDSASGQAPLAEREVAVARWVYDHGQVAGRGTDTLPFAAGIYLPLATLQGCVGVLGVLSRDEQRVLAPDQLRLLQTFAGQIALAMERIRAAEDARKLQVQME